MTFKIVIETKLESQGLHITSVGRSLMLTCSSQASTDQPARGKQVAVKRILLQSQDDSENGIREIN